MNYKIEATLKNYILEGDVVAICMPSETWEYFKKQQIVGTDPISGGLFVDIKNSICLEPVFEMKTKKTRVKRIK